MSGTKHSGRTESDVPYRERESLQVFIPKDLMTRLETFCKSRGHSKTWVTIESLKSFLRTAEQQK